MALTCAAGASGTLPRRGDTTCLDNVSDIHGRGRGTRAFRTHGSASTIPTTLGEMSNYDTEIQRDYPLQTPPTRISAAADAGYPVSPMHELSCDSNAAARSSSQTIERQYNTGMVCATPFHPPPVPYPPYGYGSMPPPWHQVQPASPGFYPRDAFHYPPAAWPPNPYHHPGYHPPFECHRRPTILPVTTATDRCLRTPCPRRCRRYTFHTAYLQWLCPPYPPRIPKTVLLRCQT